MLQTSVLHDFFGDMFALVGTCFIPVITKLIRTEGLRECRSEQHMSGRVTCTLSALLLGCQVLRHTSHMWVLLLMLNLL